MNTPSQQVKQDFEEGAVLLGSGHPDKALTCFRRALELFPDIATLHLYCGVALYETKQYQEAIKCYSHAIKLNPEMGEAYNNLGNAFLELGLFKESAESFLSAVRLLPSSPVPLTTRSTALLALGKVPEAEECCCQALEVDPSFAETHWNLALTLLLQGKFREGWQEYEWRWLKESFTSPRRHVDIPLWDGSSLEGKNILLHAEQGFGDAIQFVRYAPLVAKLGGKVVVECHPPLVTLFQELEGIDAVIPFGTPCPPCDWQAPLLSLPRIFGTVLETIPAHTPYLTVPLDRRTTWRLLMANYQAQLKIGLVWKGKSYPDPLRSCCLFDFTPLAGTTAVIFSLQIGSGAEQISRPPQGMNIVDLTPHIHDFADTAALIEQLDLVISIDTAVAHLAGALGKPVFVLLPYAPDWRWMIGLPNSPWYPTMRLFRQRQQGAWSSVIQEASVELDHLQKNPGQYTLSQDSFQLTPSV